MVVRVRARALAARATSAKILLLRPLKGVYMYSLLFFHIQKRSQEISHVIGLKLFLTTCRFIDDRFAVNRLQNIRHALLELSTDYQQMFYQ